MLTEEDRIARVGKITASKISDVLAGGKGKTRAAYSAMLMAERLTGKAHRKTFTSAALQHGEETEAEARMVYEIRNGVAVVESPFVNHPTIERAGASPDGLINDDGLAEFKCPDTHTFIEWKYRSMSIPMDYQWQMLWQIACTKRQWCDFVAFDPDLPEEDGYWCVRFQPSLGDIAALEAKVIEFDNEVEGLIAEVKNRRA